MDLATATAISVVMCQTRRKIEAIKLLRAETGMGLIDAKNYLEVYSKDCENSEALLKQLCQDFVQNKEELLFAAKKEQTYWNRRVEELEREISEEKATQPQP
jgi:translation elongation factor EF-Ts